MSKLTPEQRAEIRERASSESRRALGKAYGVSHVTITKIVQNRPSRKRLLEHEAAAVRRMHAEMSAGTGFVGRWSELDQTTVVLALARIAGIEAP